MLEGLGGGLLVGCFVLVHQQKQQAINIAKAATPPIEIPIMSPSEVSDPDLEECLGSLSGESSEDEETEDVGEEPDMSGSSKTAAKSESQSDVSGVAQSPVVHPPKTIEPSGRTATPLKSSFDVLPA